MPGPLAPYRVVDLTNERGLLCGQILADLGADVIQVEPREGNSARRLAPYAGGEAHPERSLFWWSYARNKRSVALDLGRPEGREILHRLVEKADFLIDSELPGDLAPIGLDPKTTSERHPKLVHVSITPYGQDGPKARWAASDLVLFAAGGPLVLTGDSDRAPLRIAVPQAYLHGAAEGAAGALIASHDRALSGRGQHVDVSTQQAVAQATQSSALSAPVGYADLARASGGIKMGPLLLQLIYPAKDGHVAITLVFGSAIGPFTRRLMEVVCEHGFCDEATRDKDWIGYAQLLLGGKEEFSEFERVKSVISAFTSSMTKAELFDLAFAKTLLIAPCSNMRDALASPQLAARGYWRELPHPDDAAAALRYPGAFAKFSKTPLATGRPAPKLGEHTREILREIGLDDARQAELAAKAVL